MLAGEWKVMEYESMTGNEPALLYLSHADVCRALPMADAIEAMHAAFLQLSDGQVTLPARSRVEIPEANGVVLIMPCYAAGTHHVSLKLLTQFADNGRLGLPLIQAVVLLADAVNGRLLAIVDGAAITALRTGAASGVATRLLAQPRADTAAIFGAGVQARTQLEAVCTVREIEQVRVFDCRRAAAEVFAEDMSARLRIPVLVASSAAETLAGAQVVCTATTSTTPVFEDRELAAGVHINAVGSWRPRTAEIPPDTICRARVFVDHRVAALEEAGDLLMPLQKGRIMAEHVRNELGDLIANRVAGRQTRDEVTLFKSVGLAVQDLFAAARAVENARRLGIGTVLT
jgi:ornithine cyclodeaminase/alanine dehydrogenase-like protein (mu-crystallin family)